MVYATESCRTFFTHQPPNSLPCNPYLLNATVSLQCQVSAPIVSSNLQELNFTVSWLKLSNTEGAEEQSIYGSGFSNSEARTMTHKRYHKFGGSKFESVVSVSSTLFLRFNVENNNMAGRYWCRVLSKDLNNYSYKYEGESAILYVEEKGFYDRSESFYPPCEIKEEFHNAGLKCINRRQSVNHLASTSSKYKDMFEVNFSKFLAPLFVLGGFLTVLVVVASLPTADLRRSFAKEQQKSTTGNALCLGTSSTAS